MLDQLYLYLKTWCRIRVKLMDLKYGAKENTSYTKFLIIGPARSGTTYLHTLLNFHPNIYSFGEIIRKSHLNPSFDLEHTLWDAKPCRFQALGLKVLYEHLSEPEQLKFIEKILVDPEVKIIHLKRKDLLAAFYSYQRAITNKEWSSTAEKSLDTEPVLLSEEAFKVYMETITQTTNNLNQVLQHHQVLSINYEDLVLAKDDTLKKILLFLSVPNVALQSLLKKQNNLKLEEQILNYELLRSVSMAFKGNGYMH